MNITTITFKVRELQFNSQVTTSVGKMCFVSTEILTIH